MCRIFWGLGSASEELQISLLQVAGFSGGREYVMPEQLKMLWPLGLEPPDPVLPAGVYFVTWGDVPVATACGLDRSSDPSSPIGELGWVAVDPAHRGKGLGLSVCVAVVRYLLHRGYKKIYLKTDHWRLPAIKTYLKMGFEPERTTPDARFRWARISLEFARLKVGRCRCSLRETAQGSDPGGSTFGRLR